jgi:hypothetical protein
MAAMRKFTRWTKNHKLHASAVTGVIAIAAFGLGVAAHSSPTVNLHETADTTHSSQASIAAKPTNGSVNSNKPATTSPNSNAAKTSIPNDTSTPSGTSPSQPQTASQPSGNTQTAQAPTLVSTTTCYVETTTPVPSNNPSAPPETNSSSSSYYINTYSNDDVVVTPDDNITFSLSGTPAQTSAQCPGNVAPQSHS